MIFQILYSYIHNAYNNGIVPLLLVTWTYITVINLLFFMKTQTNVCQLRNSEIFATKQRWWHERRTVSLYLYINMILDGEMGRCSETTNKPDLRHCRDRIACAQRQISFVADLEVKVHQLVRKSWEFIAEAELVNAVFLRHPLVSVVLFLLLGVEWRSAWTHECQVDVIITTLNHLSAGYWKTRMFIIYWTLKTRGMFIILKYSKKVN